MILELDIGNTQIKWRLNNGASGSMMHHQDFQSLVLPIQEPVTQLWYASVVPNSHKAMEQAFEQQFACDVFRVETSRELAGVRNSYSKVSDMGVDRWLAMVASFQQYGESVIVDCGSACTIDWVDVSGCHRGGYIMPGLGMMRHSIYDKIGRPYQNARPKTLQLGSSTDSAIDAGMMAMLVGAVKQTLGQVSGGTLVFAGGDGQWLLESVGEPNALFHHDLVLDGLTIAREHILGGEP